MTEQLSGIRGGLTAAVLDHADPTFASLIMIGAFAAYLGFLAVALHQARNGRYLGLSCMIGAVLLGFGEPVFDYLYGVVFNPDGGVIWAPFAVAQPVWVPVGYGVAFGPPGWLVARRIAQGGVTQGQIAKLLAGSWAGYLIFEVCAYFMGVMQYNGHPLALWGTPYWHQPLFAVFIVLAGITIGAAQPLLERSGVVTHVVLTSVVFIVGFSGVCFGAGYLALNVLHTPLSTGWLALAALGSTLVGVCVVWCAADFLQLVPGNRESLARGPHLLKLTLPSAAPSKTRLEGAKPGAP